MQNSKLLRTILSFCVLVLWLPTCSAVTISLNYTYDTFFGSVPNSRATLNRAAADISAAITSSLSAVTSDVWTGSFAGTTATSDWSYQYTSPTSGVSTTIQTATIAADQIVIYVGARSITTPNTLAVGGPGGMGFSINVSGSPAYYQPALNAAATAANSVYRRGGAGPILNSFDNVTFTSGSTYDFNVGYTAAYGNLWFDVDQDNNGVQDSIGSLNNYWNWDYNVTSFTGKNDLYSVALHEILHTIGFGAGQTWETLSPGTSWTGSNVIALNGTGVGLTNGGHIAQSANSYRVSDGGLQKPVMVPSLTTGQRRHLTALDLAFLRDLGYDTISLDASTQPGDYNGDGRVDAADYTVWRDSLGQSGAGLAADGDNNNTINANDYRIWRNNFGQSLSGSLLTTDATVPEPGSIATASLASLALFALIAASRHRCRRCN